ncbi:MAG: hypothetical protein DRP08_06590 [Candidatus Aenigmatarchaeota archaeon]|nr:MAG: hypothetical protein DRP08_06590 [Candidatus Aenigmarchaeota archaeon]
MRRIILIIFVFFALMLTSISQASIVMEGNYIYTQISDNGTLGDRFNFPGIQYDPEGGGNFPGVGGKDFFVTVAATAYEGFFIEFNGTLMGNANDFSYYATPISGTLEDLSETSPYDFYVRWESSDDYLVDIIIDTYFNENDEYIMFTTSITANDDITGVKFLRTILPNPDYNDYKIFYTINKKGYSPIISPEDWVSASGPETGWTIGLYSNSPLTHNTGIVSSIDPDDYLSGTNEGDGWYRIGIAFDLGDLNEGETVTFSYAYVLGESLEDAVNNIIPEPNTLFLFSSALIGFAIRRRS